MKSFRSLIARGTAAGIRLKLSAAFAVVSLVIAGFVIGAIAIQIDAIKHAARLEAEYFAKLIAYTGPGNPLGDPVFLQNYVDGLHALQGRDVVFVDLNKKGIADTDRRTIGEIFDHDPGDEVGQTIRDGQARIFVERNEQDLQDMKQIVVPLRADQADPSSAIIGAAIVEYTHVYDRLLAAAEKKNLLLLGASGIGCVLLSMLFGLRIAARLARPLEGLQHAADVVSRGNYETRVPVTSRDEIGRLAGAFNAMSGTLKSSRDALVEHGRVLEERVASRTADLSASEARFRSLTEMSSDFYWATDSEHRITKRGSADKKIGAASIFRQGAQAGERRWEVPYLSPAEEVWRQHRAALDAHRPFRNFEFSRLAVDGRERHISISGDPVFGDDGAFAGYRGVGHDVTERKNAESVLRESEERFRSLTEISADFYWESDASHRISERSSANLRKHNVPEFQRGPQIGERRWEIPYLSPDEAGWREHRATLDAHRPFRDFELSRLEADGTERHTSISGNPMFNAAAEFMGYRGVGTDITGRKRSEQLLRLEHTVARTLADAASASDALRAVMRAICEIESWECGRYFRLDEGAGVLRFEEAWAIDHPAMQAFAEGSRGIVFQRGKGLSGISWETAQPVWSADASSDPRVSQDALTRATGTHGAFVFPVLADGEAIGVFAFSSAKLRAPDAKLLDTVKMIGTQISQYVQRKRAERAARDSSEELRLFADNVPAMTVSYDADLRCRFASKAYAGFFGFAVEEIIGKHLREILGEEVYTEVNGHFVKVLQGHPVSYQRTQKRGAGEPRHLEVKLLPHLGDHGEVLGCFAVTTDITEHKLTEERIQRVAHHDSLTGLPNRLLFNDRLLQSINLAKRDSRRFALLYLDLDKFKPVNDALGHAAGDELLKEVGARIRRQIRESDTVARIGGDEFTVILADIAGRGEAEIVAGKITAALAVPFELGNRRKSIDIGASIGIAIYPADARSAEALVKVADAAMYSAKHAA
jgi:diguanylate cyclase (GGDEF)-like protein/PAS domain S-box-containing protein